MFLFHDTYLFEREERSFQHVFSICMSPHGFECFERQALFLSTCFMPPRSSPIPPKGSFYPSYDASTYRDLLLFEERLKTNAASLNRRKHRYQRGSIPSRILMCSSPPDHLSLHSVMPQCFSSSCFLLSHFYFQKFYSRRASLRSHTSSCCAG